MYQQHIELIEQSLKTARSLRPVDEIAGSMFTLFFEQYPEARSFFTDYDLSRLALIKFNIIVTTLIDTLKFPDYAEGYIAEEVHRHTIHDLRDREYYFSLIDMMVESLKQTLGEQWSEELNQHWNEAIQGMKHSIDREIRLQ